jgi:hypothetical protein
MELGKLRNNCRTRTSQLPVIDVTDYICAAADTYSEGNVYDGAVGR